MSPSGMQYGYKRRASVGVVIGVGLTLYAISYIAALMAFDMFTTSLLADQVTFWNGFWDGIFFVPNMIASVGIDDIIIMQTNTGDGEYAWGLCFGLVLIGSIACSLIVPPQDHR